MMTNYYETERYPFWLIHDFVSDQRNLGEPEALSDIDVAEDEFLSSTVSGPLSLLYRFTDDEQETPALGFQGLAYDEELDGDYQYIYELVYIDPSIDDSWKDEMNREREEPTYTVSPFTILEQRRRR